MTTSMFMSIFLLKSPFLFIMDIYTATRKWKLHKSFLMMKRFNINAFSGVSTRVFDYDVKGKE